MWCIEHTEGGLGEIVTQYDIDGDAPMRMLVSQSKDFLLLAMGFGGLTRVDMDLSSKPPILENHDGKFHTVPLMLKVSCPWKPSSPVSDLVSTHLCSLMYSWTCAQIIFLRDGPHDAILEVERYA